LSEFERIGARKTGVRKAKTVASVTKRHLAVVPVSYVAERHEPRVGSDLEEQISPELCLIDPDLARRARSRLATYHAEPHSDAGPASNDVQVSSAKSMRVDVPMSPELALVDPELAARARLHLPEPPYFKLTMESANLGTGEESPAIDAPGIRATPLRPHLPAAPQEQRRLRRPRRRKLIRPAAVAVGVAAASCALFAAGLVAAGAPVKQGQSVSATTNQSASPAAVLLPPKLLQVEWPLVEPASRARARLMR
jgi:hypothetical protein